MGYYGQPSIFSTIAKGVFIAVLAYGAFPTIFAICKPKINVKSYHWICFLVNFAVYLCFALIGGNYNAAPYLLWTLAFCFIFKRFLPEIEPPIDYSKMEKKSFEEVSSSVPEEVLEQCGSQRGSREGITRVAESFAKDGKIPLEYVPALVEEYMKPVNPVAKTLTTEEPAVEKELGICYCRFCGAKITEEDKFCHSCGAKLNSATAPKRKHQKAGGERSVDNRAFIAIGAIALLILVALIVIIIILVKADSSVPMSAQSENSIQTPVPTVISTPEPTPDEPENTIILFPSPEQNGVEWPEEIDWTVEKGTVEDWMPYYSTRLAIKQAVQDSGIGNEEADTYAAAYMAARANGENDLEAHITALTTTDVDKYLLGKREYTEYINNSASEVGVSEYDVEKLTDGMVFTWDSSISITWDLTWAQYTHSRDNRGKNHEQAIETVEWSLFGNENSVKWMEGARKEKYLECGLSKTEVSEKIEEEREELFRLLKECYEGPGLNIDR